MDAEQRKRVFALWQKGEKMDDYISRQEALGALGEYSDNLLGNFEINYGAEKHRVDDCMTIIERLPGIRMMGKWIPVEDSDCWRGYICDKCGKAINQRENFCPNCGVRMEEE